MGINQEDIKLETEQEKGTVDPAAAAAAYEKQAQAAENAGEGMAGENAAEEAPAENEVDKLKAELAEKDDRILRQQAEFQNFRRRTQKEKEELGNIIRQDVLKALLPIVDNFERALAAEASDAENLKKGVEMVYGQMMQALKDKGLKVIETEGQKFDPNFHQAVMRVQNPDLEDDTIAAELQKGYMVGEAVIRPSMVQVVAN
ncbi:MAG: nucleotide exchange factor GrpE [Selenomonadaceae bacterium]|nr:nucleotide exchange factor GrpE [Selenomonadaceae bacterium]